MLKPKYKSSATIRHSGLVTFAKVHVRRAVLCDVSRPRHTQPLPGLQLGQCDGRHVGGGHQASPQVQAAAHPELVHCPLNLQ